jgi:hypothetical protein
VQKLPVDERWKAVVKKLQELNPGDDGKSFGRYAYGENTWPRRNSQRSGRFRRVTDSNLSRLTATGRVAEVEKATCFVRDAAP